MIRISVGLEHIDDIVHDFEQSFAASDAVQTEAKPAPEPASKTVGSDNPASLSGAI
jgi:O-acetylhomoserine/O-acetylserine sulfhydrylase